MSRRWIVIGISVAAIVVGITGAGAVGATVYDRHASQYLLPGTVIQEVNVGDLQAEVAVQTLKDRLEAPLHRELTVTAGNEQIVTTPWDLGYRVDVKAAVRQAQGQAEGPLPARVWKRLFNHPQRFVPAKPTWQKGDLDTVLEQLATKVHADPVNSDLDASTGWVTITQGKNGVDLDVDAARQSVIDAAQLGDSTVTVTTKDVAPEVSRDAFNQVILVRTGENKLYLYQSGTILKSWSVATGASGFATPAGHWQVVEKIVDPVWINPGSPWAAGMPARIPAGPSNPLGQRALALSAPAILIHGTSDRASIGYSASHGCIRMLAENEQELFDMVDVGTPVMIVNAGTPQARTETPAPVDAAQAAAVQF